QQYVPGLKPQAFLSSFCKGIRWFNDRRKEYFGITAKEVENKEKLRREGYIVVQPKDLDKK
ncbi:MAG: hypothetical protein ACPLZF_07380, partial [Nitrososphaeria archaeon]